MTCRSTDDWIRLTNFIKMEDMKNDEMQAIEQLMGDAEYDHLYEEMQTVEQMLADIEAVRFDEQSTQSSSPRDTDSHSDSSGAGKKSDMDSNSDSSTSKKPGSHERYRRDLHARIHAYIEHVAHQYSLPPLIEPAHYTKHIEVKLQHMVYVMGLAGIIPHMMPPELPSPDLSDLPSKSERSNRNRVLRYAWMKQCLSWLQVEVERLASLLNLINQPHT
jgi:hypothetical protein